MKRSIRQGVLPALFLGSLFWLTGCYTQIGTTRDVYREEYSQDAQSDTTGDDYEQAYTNDYSDNNDWAPRYQYGFDYYYPTLGFTFSTFDPWYWRYSGWYYYDPFVCGTYYPAIYAGWHYWNPPVFYNYPHNGYHTYATGGGRGFRGATRTIGNTRGGGNVRGGGRDNGGGYPTSSSGGIDLPTGYRSASGTHGSSPASPPRVSTARGTSNSTHGGTRGSGVRGGNSRGGTREGTRSQSPRTYTPPARGTGSDRGSAPRSFTPPSSSPPQQSSPPASGGGRSSGSSSGSGGGTRGGRGR